MRARVRELVFPPAADGSVWLVRVPLAGGARLEPLAARLGPRPAPGEAGGLAKNVIGTIIRSGWPEIRRCYEDTLGRSPNASGKLTLRWAIGRAGGVQGITVLEDTTGDAALTSCVQEALAGWSFPAPRNGGVVVVTYPWVFVREEGR